MQVQQLCGSLTPRQKDLAHSLSTGAFPPPPLAMYGPSEMHVPTAPNSELAAIRGLFKEAVDLALLATEDDDIMPSSSEEHQDSERQAPALAPLVNGVPSPRKALAKKIGGGGAWKRAREMVVEEAALATHA